MKDPNVIYKILSGSHAHGTNIPTSDEDVRGIWLPSIDDHLKFEDPQEIRELPGQEDVVIHPIKKFMFLSMQGNPNVLDWLYVDKKLILHINDAGKEIRENRLVFLGKHIYHRMKGYADGEMKSMMSVSGKTGAKRKIEIKKYGYSPKCAMNAIRILQEGAELLRDKVITLPRPNHKELRKIKMGESNPTELIKMFNNAMGDIESAHDHSDLPETVDRRDVERLMRNIVCQYG